MISARFPVSSGRIELNGDDITSLRAFEINRRGLSRSFPLPKDFGTLVFEVDCLNVWNKVTFGNPVATFGAANFGTITGTAGSYSPRDFQFAGHINF